MSVQLFKPIFDVDSCLEQVKECMELGWTGLGFKTVEFENKFSKYTGLSHCHFLNSATNGLHLALEIIKRREGPQKIVLTTPLTFIATNHAIKYAGLEPWFVDIDNSLCLDPKLVKQFLDRNRGSVLAVMYVGLGGSVEHLEEITELCKLYNVYSIFDASHCMGTYINNKHVGAQANFTVFSFQAVKNLPTGDSGMLVCKLEADDKLARKLSWMGIDKDTYSRQTGGGNWNYDVTGLGYKYHGNAIMAGIGIAQLGILESQNAIRFLQLLEYQKRLKYKIIPHYGHSSRHLIQIRVLPSERDSLIRYAADKGVQLGVHYKPSTEYRMYVAQKNFVPVASKIWQELITLPCGPHLSGNDVDRVIEVINGYPF